MSEEQLKAFIAKVQADSSLLEQLKAEGADVVAIAKAAGFSITTEELKAHRQTLSDEELESVAGGVLPPGGIPTFTVICCLIWGVGKKQPPTPTQKLELGYKGRCIG